MRKIAIQKNMQNEAAAIIPTLQYIDGGSFAITKPSNEGSFFRPAGREKAGDESGGNTPACEAPKRYK
jgi:hypothetical protein